MIKIDKENHIYTLGGRELISVTTLLKDVGIINDRFYNPSATQRGTDVHTATELLDKGELDWGSVSNKVMPFLHGWVSFLDSYKPEFTSIESIVYDEVLGFAGTVDRIAVINNKTYIIDIKSGAKAKWHSLQLTFYGLTQEEMPLLACVYLTKIGRFKFVEYEPDIETCKSIARVYNWKIK